MTVLSNLTAQTIAPGQSVTFDKVILKAGCGECYNSQLPRSIKAKGQGIYSLGFSGNVTSATAGAVLQLAIAVGGQPLLETGMNASPATAGTLQNISTETRFRVCCCDLDRFSVINTGTTAVTLAPNSAFVIERRS